jgi:hypothetical protein
MGRFGSVADVTATPRVGLLRAMSGPRSAYGVLSVDVLPPASLSPESPPVITIGRRETATKHRSLSLWAPVIMQPSDLPLRSAMLRCSSAVFQRGISLIAAAICRASPASHASHASATSLYGLAVGINLYDLPGNNLDGAVSDAVDIAQALHKAGALDVKVLTELCFQELALWFQGWLLLEHGSLGLRGPD